MTQYLTPAEVAERLAVTEHTVRRLVKEGKLPGKKFGRSVRIPADFDQAEHNTAATKRAAH